MNSMLLHVAFLVFGTRPLWGVGSGRLCLLVSCCVLEMGPRGEAIMWAELTRPPYGLVPVTPTYVGVLAIAKLVVTVLAMCSGWTYALQHLL